MGLLDEFFPYPSYRPCQREMLDAVTRIIREGGIGMIDAPTGSGKSSVVAALLAERQGRKVVIAVRTVSQLDTFIRELALVRKKQPGLRFAYLIGKSSLCPLGGEGDVYRKCEVLKTFSTSLIRQQAARGSLVPSRDPVVRRQISHLDREHPLLCPLFINTRVFIDQGEEGLRMVPSAAMYRYADRLATEVVHPRDLGSICHDLCPYETMIQAARTAEVVILNFYHLFDDQIREQIYASLGLDPRNVILLIDEAHNCGDTVQSIQSVELQEGILDLADQELGMLQKTSQCAESMRTLIPEIRRFMEGLRSSRETEDWFDPTIFTRMIIRGSFYQCTDEIVDDLLSLSEMIREKNLKAGDFRVSGVERLALFFYKIHQSAQVPVFLTIYRREEDEVSLEVRNIDPSGHLSQLARSHASCILISGTLSPVEGYRKLYFEDLPVTTLSLPNTFSRKNRRMFCAQDITTAFSQRNDPGNRQRICHYIKEFSAVQGNIAIYFPSYQLLESFRECSPATHQNRSIFFEPRDTQDAQLALQKFLSLPSEGGSGVLMGVCGGKWSEGLDYRGEMLSGAMVIGLPLAPFNRVRQMIIQYFRNKFGEEGEFLSYTLPALNRALQALGRVIRTPEDRGVLVLGERRYLEPKIRNALPSWMQEEMEVCDNSSFGELLGGWT
ncbi:MAG: ATP-dependent DNA helicase [Methanomicrobiales archaeon]|nr:ATP-dependent DNA helicase [Methanomicrobiales archaeon]